MSAQSEPTHPEQQGPTRPEKTQPDKTQPDKTVIQSRTQQFLIASRDAAKEAALVERVRQYAGVEIVKIIAEQDNAGAIVVVRMAADNDLLRHGAEARLFIEPDHALLAATTGALPQSLLRRDPAVMANSGQSFSTTIQIHGANGQAIDGAEIYLFGSNLAFHAMTGTDGKATLTLFGETPETVSGLYVKPRHGHWSRWVAEPRLTPNGINSIELKPLSESTIPSWAVKAMGLDRLPESWRGQGIRVAVIDSGIAASHPQLTAIERGQDFTSAAERGWAEDALGHGSAVAGVLVAAGDGALRGLVPEAELHVCKVFPGGRSSDLIDALDYCMDKAIDVATLALGSEQDSELVEQRIRLAKRKGIVLIAAAGSSGDEVQYPACSPNVLAVAAMGKAGEYPEDSYHANWAAGEELSAEGYFSAEFSCVGPEVDVCAPGVAIWSCQSPQGYVVQDGTSMAVPYVAALAVQMLAHHPALRHLGRDGRRVESLFQILKQSCRPLAVGDPSFSGAGLPDAAHATGLEQGPVTAMTAPSEAVAALRRIITILQPGPVAEAAPGLEQLHAAMQQAGLEQGGEWGKTGPLRGPAQMGDLPEGIAPNLHTLRMSMVLAGLSPPQ